MESPANKKSYSWRKPNFKLNLNTKGICYICLRPSVSVEQVGNGEIHREKLFSVQNLCHLLKIKTTKLTRDLENPWSFSTFLEVNGTNLSSLGNTDVRVSLCDECGSLHCKFSELVQQLEVVQMSINHCIENYYKEISKAKESSELVENYLQLMKGDAEAIKQLNFVDKLRAEILKKCSTVRLGTKSQVEIGPSIPQQGISSIPVYPLPNNIRMQTILVNNVESTPTPIPSFFRQVARKKTYRIPPRPTKFNCKVQSSSATICLPEAINSNVGETDEGDTSLLSSQSITTFNYETNLHECTACSGTFKMWNQAYHHYMEAHQNNPQMNKKNLPNMSGEYVCNLCGNKFKRSGHLAEHRRLVHFNVRRYACEFCDLKFKTSGQLTCHKDKIHFQISLSCIFCKKKYSDRWTLRRHTRACPQKTFEPSESQLLGNDIQNNELYIESGGSLLTTNNPEQQGSNNDRVVIWKSSTGQITMEEDHPMEIEEMSGNRLQEVGSHAAVQQATTSGNHRSVRNLQWGNDTSVSTATAPIEQFTKTFQFERQERGTNSQQRFENQYNVSMEPVGLSSSSSSISAQAVCVGVGMSVYDPFSMVVKRERFS